MCLRDATHVLRRHPGLCSEPRPIRHRRDHLVDDAASRRLLQARCLREPEQVSPLDDWGGEGHGVDAVAMHLAAQHNCVGCLNLLLDRGADPTIVDGAHGGTPGGWAEYGRATDALDILKRRLK